MHHLRRPRLHRRQQFHDVPFLQRVGAQDLHRLQRIGRADVPGQLRTKNDYLHLGKIKRTRTSWYEDSNKDRCSRTDTFWETCPACKGTTNIKCRVCNGVRVFNCTECKGQGFIGNAAVCTVCNGRPTTVTTPELIPYPFLDRPMPLADTGMVTPEGTTATVAISSNAPLEEKLRKLKTLYKEGLISEEEYQRKVLELAEVQDRLRKLEEAYKNGLLTGEEYDRKVREMLE
ncbi:MAG: SHOCT domain-containing protein [Planctomycetota bacterium]